MTRRSRVSLSRRILLLTVAVGLAGLVGSYLLPRAPDRLPSPDSAAYRETVRAFYRGVAAIEVGLLDDARTQLLRAAELAPSEAAVFANLAVASVGSGETEVAAAQLEAARRLAPESSAVAFLQGQVAGFAGRVEEAATHFQRATELDVENLRARFALSQELERRDDDADALRAQRLLEEILTRQPDNLAVLVARVRLAARRGDADAVADSVERLNALSDRWPAMAREQLSALMTASEARDLTEAQTRGTLLRNVLAPVTAFRDSQAAVSVRAELIAEPLTRFLRLPSPTPTAAPPDETLAYVVQRLESEGRPAAVVAGVVLTPDAAAPAVFVADGQQVRRIDQADSVAAYAFPGGTPPAAPTAHGLVAFDWNNDFRVDLALTGGDGLRLLVQAEDGSFTETTPASAEGEPVGAGDSVGAWAADIEMDGDLDILLARSDAPPQLLRNNGDGTWLPTVPFPAVTGLRGFAWGDLDGDGDPDAALLDATGGVSLFSNQQSGQLLAWPGPDLPIDVIALGVGDLNADGRLDLVTFDTQGGLWRSSWLDEEWETETVATWASFPSDAAPASHRLLLADLDNNGALDVTASGVTGTRIWLSDERSTLQVFDAAPEAELFGVVQLNGDGWLDFVGVVDGAPVQVIGQGTAGYHWQEIRPRAQVAAGDQRINSFGVGGEIEVRAGLLVQKQLVAGTPLHFGLGENPQVDVTRIVWPNGVVQADFDLRADQVVIADQRLKGSCPWVFAYDGTELQFVTDFLWRSPLGLRINAQDTAGVTQTEDWVLIRGDQLMPSDGEYDIRITAELWETHFFDHVSLMVVDHPEATEVFVDERFARDPAALATYVTGSSRPVRKAWDDAGADVSDLVRARDGQYVATFERGQYQGVTRDHFVEIELGDDAANGAWWLLAHGWVYPTDSSINVAMGQGRHPAPKGVALEALDAQGRWTEMHADLGFPAGKNKTMVIELRPTSGGSLPKRLRLRTNLEVYWDWIGYAPRAEDATTFEEHRVAPRHATLRYRGFSRTDLLGPRGLEVPRYEVGNIRPRWRDLVGYHTRFGDVRALLADVDDRYVIMNAGDELSLRFPAPAAPPAGWQRDFVLIGDGWVKDGDYNTKHSQTVGPLPSHDQRDYGVAAASALEDDVIYRRFPEDWRTYHTRFVAPTEFLRGLSRAPSP